jgi:hypothetical protein
MSIRSALLAPAVITSVLAFGSLAGAASASGATVPTSAGVSTANTSTASQWDWSNGYRSGYGQGFADARQACSRHGSNGYRHSRASDYERGFAAGYDKGFTTAYSHFCGR